MIYVLHGKDTESSYNRLSQILDTFQNLPKLKLTEKEQLEDFYLAVFSKDLINSQKIVICENYLHDKKIKGHVLAEIPKNKIVIFWEQNQLAPAEIAKIKKDCGHLSLRIETFKPQPQIFWFLDSISPNLEKTLELLSRLPEKNTNLIFQFENRMLFLILARLKVKMETAGKIAGLNVLDWQWTKIKRQSIRS